jgi:hypothetical protein
MTSQSIGARQSTEGLAEPHGLSLTFTIPEPVAAWIFNEEEDCGAALRNSKNASCLPSRSTDMSTADTGSIAFGSRERLERQPSWQAKVRESPGGYWVHRLPSLMEVAESIRLGSRPAHRINGIVQHDCDSGV